ncbi:hypothetical protein SAMN05421538_10563 [Paracoccus isoporae]|uniref:Uncharacterized protein n=1 Tax=Paracoccus isoporae TaxID=591205 RepID=A0A1G7BE31_9RHOB|nr:hypothetical protein SAMN05421538_10563 [Paracoccus isoporae]
MCQAGPGTAEREAGLLRQAHMRVPAPDVTTWSDFARSDRAH